MAEVQLIAADYDVADAPTAKGAGVW